MSENEGSPQRSAVKKIFRPRKTSKGQDSLLGHDGDGDGGPVELRDSHESLLTKLRKSKDVKERDEAAGAVDGVIQQEGEEEDGKRRSKLRRLLPRRSRTLKSKRSDSNFKGNINAFDAPDDDDGGQRGRGPYANNQSVTTLGTGPGTPGEHASLMTSDSDDDGPRSPPPLLNRPSHKGYLVSTSPRIQATTVTTITGGAQSQPILEHSSTLPISVTDSLSKQPSPGLQHGRTMAGNKLGVEPASGRSQSRSISPGSRIKDAFRASSRKSSPSKGSPNDGERESRPETRDGVEAPAHQRPPTSASTQSLPASIMTHHIDGSIPPVPPVPASPPAIAINGTGLGSKRSLNSIIINEGTRQSPWTTVTPPTPVVGVDDGAPRTPPSRASPNAASAPFPPPGAHGHRRTRSDSSTKAPSKLSQSVTPLTPMAEEPPGQRSRNVSQTSGGSNGSGGFFSSMFNAAQSMTTSLTSMGANANRPRGATAGSGTGSIPEATKEEEEAEAETTHEMMTTDNAGEVVDTPQALAIDTMGTGNLSLSHLGITTDSPQAMQSPGSAGGLRSRSGTQVRHEEHSANMEDASAAEAVSAAYSSPLAVNGLDRPATAVAEDTTLTVERPPSQGNAIGARTPPAGSVYDGEGGSLVRSSSFREKIRDRKSRGHRNSSTTTIGAAIAASHGVLGSPSRNASTTHKLLEGFVYANKKRDKEYHQLFRSVPEDDHLLDDYSCALQRDIILAGRIYVSEGHVCFSSNILGWVTNLIISFDEIVAVEKESTAMVFPNAIAIQTLHARHTFRSLLSREATYDLMISVWRTSHPNLQTSETGTKLLSGAEAIEAEKAQQEDGGSSSGSGDEDSDDDDDENSDEGGSGRGQSKPASIAPSDAPAASSPARKASAMAENSGAAATQGPTVGATTAATAATGAANAAERDFPGPATHPPAECTDSANHYENLLKDDVIPAPLGKVYSMVFGPASGGFMSRWLMDEAKCWDIEVTGGGQLKALDNDNKTRTYTYMKPLYGAIGPKQTKCVVTEQLDAFDLERAVSVTVTTQTPDVPSGNVFSSKTRYCFMWGPNNGTKVHMSFFTEWTGKSWIKGPIEKGSKEGQGQYADDLVKALKAGVSTGSGGSRARAGSKTKKGKKSKKGANGDADASAGSAAAQGGRKKQQEENWGLLEPLRPIFGPVVDPVKPLFSARVVCGLLLLLLVTTWLRGSRSRGSSGRPLDGAEREAAILGQGPPGFERVWRTEEEALWTWLEQRVGLQGGVPAMGGTSGSGANAAKSNADTSKSARKDRQKVIKGRAGDDVSGMSAREIEYALKVTKDKLGRLERAMGVVADDLPVQEEAEGQQQQEV